MFKERRIKMTKRIIAYACVALALCFILTAVSSAETGAQKARNFWQKLFNYPANVTKESVSVVAETAKDGTVVVTKEVKTVGQVTSGDVAKTKELVTEPITGTADTAVKAVEGTAKIPVEAAKEEPKTAETK